MLYLQHSTNSSNQVSSSEISSSEISSSEISSSEMTANVTTMSASLRSTASLSHPSSLQARHRSERITTQAKDARTHVPSATVYIKQPTPCNPISQIVSRRTAILPGRDGMMLVLTLQQSNSSSGRSPKNAGSEASSSEISDNVATTSALLPLMASSSHLSYLQAQYHFTKTNPRAELTGSYVPSVAARMHWRTTFSPIS